MQTIQGRWILSSGVYIGKWAAQNMKSDEVMRSIYDFENGLWKVNSDEISKETRKFRNGKTFQKWVTCELYNQFYTKVKNWNK